MKSEISLFSMEKIVTEFCNLKLKSIFSEQEEKYILEFLLNILENRRLPVKNHNSHWPFVTNDLIDSQRLLLVSTICKPCLNAISQWIKQNRTRRPKTRMQSRIPAKLEVETAYAPPCPGEQERFADALQRHTSKNGFTYWSLHKAITNFGEKIDKNTLLKWINGSCIPRTAHSFVVLNRIEAMYGLPNGYFKEKIPIALRSHRYHQVSTAYKKI